MSILISWLGPLRAICMAIDGIAFSLLDQAYNIVIELSSARILEHDAIKKIMFNLYILFGVVAFFRLALVLVNSILDPEKLNEKGKGLGNIFFRVVGMIIILGVTPFLFEMSYDVQEKIVSSDKDKNVIFSLILGDDANIGGYDKDGYNAGKALQNVVLSSLITIDDRYLVNDGEVCTINKKNQYVDSSGNVINDGEVNTKCGFVPLTCVPESDGKTCIMQGGYIYDGSNGKCDWKNCQNAVDKYNKMYVNEDMKPSSLAGSAGVSAKIDTEAGEKEEVYVYDYMFIVTSIAGVAMTWIILSFAIDIAVRMFELIVLEVLSPLFIATFVDPKSAQSGPFKNWLSAVGKSYASLYIKLAILALMTLLIMIVNQSEVFNKMSGDIKGFAKIFVIFGLLVFAKKAPKWIMDMIGIKGDGMGLYTPGKLKDAMLGGALAAKAGRTAASLATGAARYGHALKKANKALQQQDGLNAFGRAKKAYKTARDNNKSKGQAVKDYLGTYFSKDGAKQNLKNWGNTQLAGLKGIGSGVVEGAKIGFNAKDIKEANAQLKSQSKDIRDLAGYKSPAAKLGKNIQRGSDKLVESVIGSKSAQELRKKNLADKELAEKMLDAKLYMNSEGDLFYDSAMTDAVAFDPKTIRKKYGNTVNGIEDIIASMVSGTSNSHFTTKAIASQTYIDSTGNEITTGPIATGTLVRDKKDANGNVIYDKEGNVVKEAILNNRTGTNYTVSDTDIENAIKEYKKAAKDKTGKTGYDFSINGATIHLTGQGVLEYEAAFANIIDENANTWISVNDRKNKVSQQIAELQASFAAAQNNLNSTILETEYGRAENRKKELQSQFDNATRLISEYSSSIGNIEQDIANARNQLSNNPSPEISNRLNEFINSKKAELANIKSEKTKLEAENKSLDAAIRTCDNIMADPTLQAEYNQKVSENNEKLSAITSKISSLQQENVDITKELGASISYGSDIITKVSGQDGVALNSSNSERFLAETSRLKSKTRENADNYKKDNNQSDSK